MPLYDHFLNEDADQLEANLFVMHQSLNNILEGSTKADFRQGDDSLVQFMKSYQIIKTLHLKKKRQDEYTTQNNVLYRQMGWMRYE